MDFDFKYFAMMLGFQIPHIVTVVFNAVYYFKKKTVDGILMLIGGVIGVFVGISHLIIQLFLMSDHENTIRYSTMLSFASIVGLLFNILYTIGFILLMLKVSKTHTDNFSQRIDLIDPNSNV